jgi:YbbR domain-containing protein
MQIRQNLRFFWGRAIGHISTLFLSLIMGTIVWLIAINEANPLIMKDFPETIPVEVRGLDESKLQPIQDLSNEYVRLILRAPKSSWDNLRTRDIAAYVDLSNLGKGSYEVPIRIEKSDNNIEVIETQRGQLRVQLDDVITKTVPVEVAVMDNAEYGYAWQKPTVSPEVITAIGPAAQVDRVTSAVAAVYLRGARNQVERLEKIQVLDRQNQPIANVSAEPAEADVIIPVARWPGQRSVAVRVVLSGELASGYRLRRVTATPSSVVLYGPVNILDQMSGVVSTTPLTLTNVTENIRTTLDLILPEGINASEGNSVLVVAEILPIEDGTTFQLKPVVTKLGPGLSATYAPDMVDVILSGPVNLLSSLGPGDVYVLLDLDGLTAGNYVIQPQIAKPNDVRLDGVLPETVEVVITSSTTATVTSTATSPITATVTLPVTPTVPVPGAIPALPITPTLIITES